MKVSRNSLPEFVRDTFSIVIHVFLQGGREDALLNIGLCSCKVFRPSLQGQTWLTPAHLLPAVHEISRNSLPEFRRVTYSIVIHVFLQGGREDAPLNIGLCSCKVFRPSLQGQTWLTLAHLLWLTALFICCLTVPPLKWDGVLASFLYSALR